MSAHIHRMHVHTYRPHSHTHRHTHALETHAHVRVCVRFKTKAAQAHTCTQRNTCAHTDVDRQRQDWSHNVLRYWYPPLIPSVYFNSPAVVKLSQIRRSAIDRPPTSAIHQCLMAYCSFLLGCGWVPQFMGPRSRYPLSLQYKWGIGLCLRNFFAEMDINQRIIIIFGPCTIQI